MGFLLCTCWWRSTRTLPRSIVETLTVAVHENPYSDGPCILIVAVHVNPAISGVASEAGLCNLYVVLATNLSARTEPSPAPWAEPMQRRDILDDWNTNTYLQNTLCPPVCCAYWMA